MLSANDPEVQDFLKAWHANGRANFEKQYTNLVYDTYYEKRATDRKRFIALDRGQADIKSWSGAFLLDRDTRHVWSIKAYGVPNRRVGTLEGLTRAYWAATAENKELPGPGYVATDHALNLASQAANEEAAKIEAGRA